MPERKKVKGVWNWKQNKEREETTLTVEYFYIVTKNPEQFLIEMDAVCQKFAVKGEDRKLDYGFRWEKSG